MQEKNKTTLNDAIESLREECANEEWVKVWKVEEFLQKLQDVVDDDAGDIKNIVKVIFVLEDMVIQCACEAKIEQSKCAPLLEYCRSIIDKKDVSKSQILCVFVRIGQFFNSALESRYPEKIETYLVKIVELLGIEDLAFTNVDLLDRDNILKEWNTASETVLENVDL